MTTTIITTTTDRRQALINGLHELATFLHDHPDVPVNHGQTIVYCAGLTGDDAAGLAELAGIATRLDTEVTSSDDSHFYARRRFGPVAYEATYIRNDHMAAYEALMSYTGSVSADRTEATA